eukprot:scaffold196621_cov40-Prasinocladus_malaysianus.AAC.1
MFYTDERSLGRRKNITPSATISICPLCTLTVSHQIALPGVVWCGGSCEPKPANRKLQIRLSVERRWRGLAAQHGGAGGHGGHKAIWAV